MWKSIRDWRLDEKEYFEGSKSGYKNTVEERDVLGEALLDAKKGEYQILAVYKDDRIGRRMWEIGSYVMRLKSYGVRHLHRKRRVHFSGSGGYHGSDDAGSPIWKCAEKQF